MKDDIEIKVKSRKKIEEARRNIFIGKTIMYVIGFIAAILLLKEGEYLPVCIFIGGAVFYLYGFRLRSKNTDYDKHFFAKGKPGEGSTISQN